MTSVTDSKDVSLVQNNKLKRAFITGITGQDGSLLAELLLSKGYIVHGLIRRKSSESFPRLKSIINKVTLHYGDITDRSSLASIFNKYVFDEIYNLAAMSFVGTSFESPDYTMMVNTIGVLNLLEELRCNANLKGCRFYQASTSEMFGGSPPPQNEKTIFYPKSPYGVSKLAAYHLVVNYRESYNLFASNGILFNHESSRRGKEFVTRKITKAVAAISKGGPVLKLGNLDAVRDWGHSKDFVEAQYLLLHQEKAMDLVIGTGIGTTVRSFVEKAFKVIGVNIKWEGKALTEVGKDAKSNKVMVQIDKEFFRPAEVETLICDNTKMKAVLKWQPKITLDEMVKEMVEADIAGNDC